MARKVEVSISPYIPLSPNPSSGRPVNGYFEIRIRYGGESGEQETAKEGAEAYKVPTVTVSGFVKEAGDATAVFNTSDEFAAFVRSLQFDDTEMYKNWVVEKADGRNLLKIRKKTGTPPEENLVCSLHSLGFNPTNGKGDDGRAILKVTAEGFPGGEKEQYEIAARKIYVAEILSFQEKTGNNVKKIGEDFTLVWNCRGDMVNAAQLQANDSEPEDVDVSGSRLFLCGRPTVYKLSVKNRNPGVRFSATAYVEIEVSSPEILKFEADRQYIYAGEEVTLSWKADSAYGCQLDGGRHKYDAEDSVTVSPDFESAEASIGVKDAKSAEYCLSAYGYIGKEPFRAEKKLRVRRTFWEKREGELQGIDLAGMREGQTEGIFYNGEKYYVFEGQRLLSSVDGVVYRKESELLLKKGYRLNGNYKCGLYKDTFYIAGIQAENDIMIASYRMDSGEWDLTYASENGEKFLNGCFCPDMRHDRFYYVYYINKSVYIYEKADGWNAWTWIGHEKFGRKIMSFGCCCREDQLYLSLLFEDNKLENYSMTVGGKGSPGELVKRSVIGSGESNITLVCTDNQVLILGERAVYEVSGGNRLDIGCPGKILAGMDSRPVIICREGEGYGRYCLHIEEDAWQAYAEQK